MLERNFRQMLEARWAERKAVCVGLDTDYDQISAEVRKELIRRKFAYGDTVTEIVWGFNWAIINATRDLVCAYKPNIAFYEAYGESGLTALAETVMYIRDSAPGVPIILDAKRADIGSTNDGYVRMAFQSLGVDAITVHPYLGAEAVQPFLNRGEKGIFVLVRTSNPGAGEFQDLQTMTFDPRQRPAGVSAEEWLAKICAETMPLYLRNALHVATQWNKKGNCGIVYGATYPDELAKVRQTVGDMPILIPGVGFQQKNVPLEKQVEQVVFAGKGSWGQSMIINSARAIIFASKGPDFAEAARQETLKLHNLINQYR